MNIKFLETKGKAAFLLSAVWALLTVAVSCDSEDDIDEIFIGHTWKITGATINGQGLESDDITALYTTAGTYELTFSASTFNGTLVAGSSISGSWSADGHDKSFSMHFSKAENTTTPPLTVNLYNILRQSTSYDGDSHVLRIKQDSNNFVRLTRE